MSRLQKRIVNIRFAFIYKRGDTLKKRIKLLYIATAILVLGGCQRINLNTQTNLVEEVQKEEVSWAEKYDSEDTGIIVGIDEEKETITVKKVDSGVKLNLNYTGATNVTDKYESVLVMKQLPIGEIINVYYNKDDLIARKVEISSEAWEYTEVLDLSYDQTEKIIYIAGEKYRYGDSLTLISNGKEGNLLDLNSIDIVTIKGINKRICSVIVTRGHGYISLENDETFIDGWIDVGQESARPITEDMLVVASEGNHKVTVAKDGAGGTKSVTVKRNEKTVVDVSDLKSETKKSGSIKFIITPDNASLYIDGVKTNYSELVVLDYGIHRIIVKTDGSADFSQTIVVGSSYSEIEIKASKTSNSSSAGSISSSDTKTDAKEKNDSNTNSNNTGTKKEQTGGLGTNQTGGTSTNTNNGSNINNSTNNNNNTDTGTKKDTTDYLNSGTDESLDEVITGVIKDILSN